jgi:hypothetical protein
MPYSVAGDVTYDVDRIATKASKRNVPRTVTSLPTVRGERARRGLRHISRWRVGLGKPVGQVTPHLTLTGRQVGKRLTMRDGWKEPKNVITIPAVSIVRRERERVCDGNNAPPRKQNKKQTNKRNEPKHERKKTPNRERVVN